jgi:hypothetical protein
VPFGFRRKSRTPPSGTARGAPRRPGMGVAFEGLTEEWRLAGTMDIQGRLSDALNKREAIAILDVSWAPIDGSAPFATVPGLKSLDPYDLIIVLAGEDSQPPMSDSERAAFKVHKIAYDVALEAPPFRIVGTVFLYPGSEPARLLDRATEMFVPVTDAIALLDDVPVTDAGVDVVLVNRFYLRGVEQVDKRTRNPVPPLPGRPLGGVSYSDRSR